MLVVETPWISVLAAVIFQFVPEEKAYLLPPKKSQTRGATSALESEQEECGSVTNLTQEADLEPSKPH